MLRMSKSSCPVPYTCPAIDECQQELKECLHKLSEAEESLHLGEYCNTISIIHDIRDIISTYTDMLYSPLENLRGDNIKLREWGETLEKEINNLKNNID